MQNRFGFKDFVLLVVILVIGLLVVLQMLQADRVWSRIGDIQSKMSEIEQQIAMGGNDDLRRELSELKTLIATRPININLGGGPQFARPPMIGASFNAGVSMYA